MMESRVFKSRSSLWSDAYSLTDDLLFNPLSKARIPSRAMALIMLAQVLTGCTTSQQAHTTVPNQDCTYSFSKAPFISPRIIQDLSTWISDQGDQVVAINLSDSQHSNRYSGDPQVKHIEGQNPIVCHEESTIQSGETNTTKFNYQYVGRTDSGIDVLRTSDWGGGSGVFMNLLLVRLEQDQSISCDWDKGLVQAGKNRLLLKKLGEIALGDRWKGELAVKSNAIFVGKDEGWFAESGGTGGGPLSYDRKDRWLKIDLDTKRPTDKRANDPTS